MTYMTKLLYRYRLGRKRADQGRRLNKTVNLYAPLRTTTITTSGGIPFAKGVLQNVLSTSPL